MHLNKEQVMAFLPHRDPFLFIDSVEKVELPETASGDGPFTAAQLVGGKTTCHFKVDDSVTVLRGHFPGNPILPGVVQVEMMAQAGSFLAQYTLPKGAKLEVALLSVDSARFRKPVIPPMDLVITTTMTKVRGPIWMFDCQIHSQGDLISQCNVMASIKN